MNEVILLVLENKLGITNQIALAKAEERISKQKAKHLYDSGKINEIEVGTFKGLANSEFSEGEFSFCPINVLRNFFTVY